MIEIKAIELCGSVKITMLVDKRQPANENDNNDDDDDGDNNNVICSLFG